LIGTHLLPLESFREFAAGSSDAAGREVLRSAQLNKHLLLLRELSDRANGTLRQEAARADWTASLDLLVRVDHAYPAETRAVLAYPHVGAWLITCLDWHTSPLWIDLAHIGSIAAAAAIRAGEDFSVTTPVRGGRVHLPTLGAVEVKTTQTLVTTHGSAGRYWVDDGGTRVTLPEELGFAHPHWLGLRRLAGTSITLDDIDPYRPNARVGFAERLSADDFAEWDQRFHTALNLLGTDGRTWAVETAGLISSVVPLRQPTHDVGISITSRDAFGSFSTTLPARTEDLAATLVHESQHNKLGALHTLIPLVKGKTTDRYYSPWRSDTRPAYGLLHGCYAFAAVADFWFTDIRDNPLAAFQFLRSARQVNLALTTLTGCGQLTSEGVEFVASLSRKTETWRLGDVAADIRTTVDDLLDNHWITWCLANRSVDVTSVAARWVSGSDPGQLPEPVLVDTVSHAFTAGPRLLLATQRLADPAGFTASQHREASAEIALAEHDYPKARSLFADLVHNNNVTTWSGLALAASRTDGPVIWLERPELIMAVHRRLAEKLDRPPAPDAIAGWLASGR